MTSFDPKDRHTHPMDRRTFLAVSTGAAISFAMAGLPRTAAAASSSHKLPALPYADTELAPVITARTLSFHYGKHHQGYVNNLNRLITGTSYADLTLEEIVTRSSANPDHTALFNNAAQVWNHTFYWQSLSPKGGGEPPSALKRKMDDDFGSVDACRQALLAAATSQFGSGWHGLFWKRHPESLEHRQCRNTAYHGHGSAAHHRRMGTCVLPGLSEPAQGLCRSRA